MSEDGEHTLPIPLKDQDGKETLPVKWNVKIDTHAPIITSIVERDTADTVWKQTIDALTFQSAFGTGKTVEINASDALINPSIQTSGVAEITYQIYTFDQEQEKLIEEGVIQQTDTVSIELEDTGPHKVCAIAKDQAGLTGDEYCVLTKEQKAISVLSENSGLILRSNAFQHEDVIQVHEAEAAALTEFKKVMPDAKVIATYQFTWNENQDNDLVHDAEVVVPLTAQQLRDQGTWIQKQQDDSYQRIETQSQGNAMVLKLNSLREVFYIQAQEPLNRQVEKERQLFGENENPEIKETSNQVHTYAFQKPSLQKNDITILLYAGGGLVIVLFVILLIRSGREEQL